MSALHGKEGLIGWDHGVGYCLCIYYWCPADIRLKPHSIIQIVLCSVVQAMPLVDYTTYMLVH
jgi:hypothetical protein